MLKQRRDELDAAIAGLDAAIQAARGLAEQKAGGSLAGRLKTLADAADGKRKSADGIRNAANLRFAAEPLLANSAVPALVAIDNALGQQIMSRRPSLEQYFTVLQNAPGIGTGALGSAPPGTGAPAASVAETQTEMDKLREKSGFSMIADATDIDQKTFDATRRSLDEASARTDAAAALVAALNQKIPETQANFDLAPCAYLAPELAVADISFDPAGDALKVKKGGHLVVQIKGGGKSDSFGAFLQQNVQDLQVTPVGLRMLRIGAGTGTPAGAHAIVVSSTVTGRTAVLTVTVE